MSSKREELNENALDNVVGGLTFETTNKTVHANYGGTVYHFYNREDLVNWATAHIGEYNGWDPDKRDDDMIRRLLEAGIIY